MKQLTKSPSIGQQLIFVQAGNQIPCEVVQVSASVCQVKLLAGGVNNSLAGKVVRAHVALLRTA